MYGLDNLLTCSSSWTRERNHIRAVGGASRSRAVSSGGLPRTSALRSTFAHAL